MATYSIIGISTFGFPGTSTELQKLGKIANAFGAAGVQSVGGVPVPTSKLEHLKNHCLTCVCLLSRGILQGYLPQMEFGKLMEYVLTCFNILFWKLLLNKLYEAFVHLGGGFIGNELTGFTQSLERDALVANNILSSIERHKNNWTNFLAILEDCEGQVFTSGIGKLTRIS